MNRFWKSALDRMLKNLIKHGALFIVMPDGTVFDYGDAKGTPFTVRIHNWSTVRHLALSPEMALGEAYMDQSLTIDGDDLRAFLAMIVHNVHRTQKNRVWWQKPLLKTRATLRKVAHNNAVQQSRQNVAHHYDLSGRLYELFLDDDRQYSCAYFKDPSETLEQAQANKKEHIARKLMIEPGMRVLDIGCGWGGMALALAEDFGAHVVGITLSREQHSFARERAKQNGMSDQVEIRLCDYRNVTEQFDRIVSIGMFEHVGLRHFDTFFKTIRGRLTPNGIALVHTIGWAHPSKGPNPWISKHIFPGGYIPTVAEAMTSIEKAKLWATDIECWRLHYAYTLNHWYDRFNNRKDEVHKIYDDRFVRMWRFYLAASEQTFRHGFQAVYQFQLSRNIDAVPITRDYLYPAATNRASAQKISDKQKKDLAALIDSPTALPSDGSPKTS